MPKSDRAAGPSGAAPGPANPHPPARRVWLARAALAPWGAAATLASARTGASAAPAAPVAPTTARAPQGDRKSRIVIIGRDLAEGVLEETLAFLNRSGESLT